MQVMRGLVSEQVLVTHPVLNTPQALLTAHTYTAAGMREHDIQLNYNVKTFASLPIFPPVSLNHMCISNIIIIIGTSEPLHWSLFTFSCFLFLTL